MVLNRFEHKTIKISKLPASWQSKESRDELESFLQANWNQRKAFYNEIEDDTKQQFVSFSKDTISTKNYVGTIVFKGEQLNIFPKVFKVDGGDDDADDLDLKFLMKNLVIWINYCKQYDYPYLNLETDLENSDNLKDLFVALFIKYLLKAIDRSTYFRYEDKEEDLSSIKGYADLRDYIIKKYANGNLTKFHCRYTEFTEDNLLNQIIKHTCKVILSSYETSTEQKKDLRKITLRLFDVTDRHCIPSDCDKIHLNKMQSHYKIILSMCKILLLNKMSNFSYGSSDSFCFLFPTEVLFEGFVGGYISSFLSEEANVKLQESSSRLVDKVIYEGKEFDGGFTLRHDIFIEKSDKLFILDTKYKELPRFNPQNPSHKFEYESNVSQTDLYQMYAYASKRGINDVYLLYPLYKGEEDQSEVKLITSNVISKLELENPITIHVLRIPFVFEDGLESETKERLNKIITDII